MCPLSQNFFEHLWEPDPELPLVDQIKDHAEKLAYVLAKDEAATARIPNAVKRLKITMAYNRPLRTKICLWSFFLRGAAQDCLSRFFRLLLNVFKRPRRIALWSALLLIHPLYSAALIFGWIRGARAYLDRIYEKGDVGGMYLIGAGRILIFVSELGRGAFTHEIMHWLKDQGLILSDHPTASIMDKLYEGTAHELGAFCVDDAVPFTYRWIVEYIDRVIDQEISQSARDRRSHLLTKTEDPWLYSEQEVFGYLALRGVNAVMCLDAIETVLKGAVDQDPLSDRWYLFMPTVIYMRCQLFSNRDFFFMDKRGNPQKLHFIYHFALLVSKYFDQSISQEPAKTDRIKKCAHSLLQSYDKIPAIDRQRIQRCMGTWIDRISSSRFNRYEERLLDKCSCIRMNTGQCPEKPLMKLSRMARYGISNWKRVSLPLTEKKPDRQPFLKGEERGQDSL